MKLLATGLVTAIALAAPLGAFAQHRPAHVSAPPARPAPPVTRAAPPAARPAGFDLHEDIRSPRTNPPIISNRHINVGRPPPTASRPPVIGRLGYGGQVGGHRIIQNPRYNGPAWGWNHGRTWNPAPRYWGGGFWGPFALVALPAVAFGTLYYMDDTLTSYQVEPDSPGAQMLQNYQLTQVPCGSPGLVVIFGPDESVICAQPNDYVAAGEYQLDPSQLTIVSLDQ